MKQLSKEEKVDKVTVEFTSEEFMLLFVLLGVSTTTNQISALKRFGKEKNGTDYVTNLYDDMSKLVEKYSL